MRSDSARLQDVAEIVMGQSPPGETYNTTGHGLPFFQGAADFGVWHPEPRVWCSAPRRIAEPGDVLVTVRAPIGRVNVAVERCATGRGVAIIRSRAEADRLFLPYALTADPHAWERLDGGGSVFGNATKRDLESMHIPWPSTRSRATAGQLLSTLDRRSTVESSVRRTLKHLLDARFRVAFIDREQTSPPWPRTELGDHFSVARGISYEGAELGTQGTPMVNLGCFTTAHEFDVSKLKRYRGTIAPRNVLRPGDVVLANTDITQQRAVLGTAGLVPSSAGNQSWVFSHHVFALRPMPEGRLHPIVAYLYLQMREFRKRAQGFATGTTVLALPQDAVTRYVVPMPPDDIQARFVRFAQLVLDRIDLVDQCASSLVAARNLVLSVVTRG